MVTGSVKIKQFFLNICLILNIMGNETEYKSGVDLSVLIIGQILQPRKSQKWVSKTLRSRNAS